MSRYFDQHLQFGSIEFFVFNDKYIFFHKMIFKGKFTAIIVNNQMQFSIRILPHDRSWPHTYPFVPNLQFLLDLPTIFVTATMSNLLKVNHLAAFFLLVFWNSLLTKTLKLNQIMKQSTKKSGTNSNKFGQFSKIAIQKSTTQKIKGGGDGDTIIVEELVMG